MNEAAKMNGKTVLKSVKDLDVYNLAMSSAMLVFDISKRFPKEETYSLTDQIRRSSRSVSANLAEAWSKRQYPAVFLNKLTDCCAETAETQTWLEFALKCKYLENADFELVNSKYDHIYAMLKTMEKMPDKFCKNGSKS